MSLITVILLIIGCTSSFFLGFYLALYFQNQLQLFGQIGNIIPVFSVIGPSVVVWKLFSDWYNQPTVEFGCIYAKKSGPIISINTGITFHNSEYYLVVNKKRGRGIVENCEGLLKVEGTNIEQYTIWKTISDVLL